MELENPQLIRLQKIIADRGICSRREAEKFITEGAVKVNGKVITELGTKADPEKDSIEVDKNTLQRKEDEKLVIALNKPLGYVTSTKKTEKEKKIFLDLFPKNFPRIFPVGRLDKDTSGVLIVTNDGDISFKLTHPKFQHTKTYEVLLSKPISDEDLNKIRTGDIRILGQKTKPAPVRKLGGVRIEIILQEGKNRQIRRIFRFLGNGVKKLRRVAIGKLRLENLKIDEGKWKKLSEEEIHLLFKKD